MKNKTLFFWCCKKLGYDALRYLTEVIYKKYPEFKIIGVCVSHKDKYLHRIKIICHEYSIPVFEDNETDLPNADLGLCIGFPKKISLETIKKFNNGVINLHFAPLPQYRGSGTLTHAIINKEKKYGLTLHYMDEELDTGDIISVRWFELLKDTSVRKMVPIIENEAYDFFIVYAEKMLTTIIPATSQNKILEKNNIRSQFCTKKSVTAMLQLSLDWPEEKLSRYIYALTTGKKDKPYFIINNKKIFLYLEE